MTETASTAFEGYCQAHHRDEPCDNCANDERVLTQMRENVQRAVTVAAEAEAALKDLFLLLADLRRDFFYSEFYSDLDADDDAEFALSDATRLLRSFARIARERAARTRQDP